MSEWAFLAAGAVSVFSGRALPQPRADGSDSWVPVPGDLRPLALDELPRWLDEELWLVELAPDRGRACLVRRHPAWSADAARAFASDCAWRARDQAARVLERHGHPAAARELGSLDELAAVEAWAAREDIDELPPHAAFAADAAALTDGRRPDSWRRPVVARASRQPAAVIAANLGFVVAHGAGLEAADGAGPDAYERGVDSERAWQAGWLVDRLALAS